MMQGIECPGLVRHVIDAVSSFFSLFDQTFSCKDSFFNICNYPCFLNFSSLLPNFIFIFLIRGNTVMSW